MKRFLGILVAVIMLASLGSAGASAEKVSVDFWHSMSGKNNELLEAVVKNFNESQDGIEVVLTYQGSYHDATGKLQQSIAAGTAPDIMMLERAFIEYFSDADALLDLTQYVDAAGMNDFFNPGLLGHSFFNDKMVSVPFNRSTPIMHVNKTALDELGLEIPNTWEELKAATAALVIKDGDETVRYGFTMPYDTWYPLAMINQQGAAFINEDKTGLDCIEGGEMVKMFQFIKDMQNEGILIYPPQGYGGDYCNQLFIEGKVGIMYQSTGSIGGIKDLVDFEYTTAFLAMDEYRSTPTGGANVAIISESDCPDEAWAFIEWAMKDPNGVLPFIVGSGYLPFADSLVESEPIQALWAANPMYRTAYEQLEYAQDTNKSVFWPELNDEFLLMVEAIMYDSADIEERVAAYNDEAVFILNQ